MLNQIKTRMSRWYADGMKIGDIFVKFAEFMKVYTAYVNNYNDAFMAFTEFTQRPAVAEVNPLTPYKFQCLLVGVEVSSFLITFSRRFKSLVNMLT